MTSNKKYRHFEVNDVTGEVQWFFPMEIEVNPYDYPNGSDAQASARAYVNSLRGFTDENGQSYEIGEAKLGFREFMAVFVPVTHEMYLDLIKDEMNKQEEMKQDGRCFIPAKIGGLKICPRRIPNPDYVEGSDMPKTIANSCENCKYCNKKHEHTMANFSTLAAVDEDGELTDYDPVSPANYYGGDRYEVLMEKWKAFILKNAPELLELAELFALEYLRSEAARELKKSSSTVQGQRDTLKRLVVKFLANEVL